MDHDKVTREKILQHLEMLATKVNFDQLCDEGILLRVSKKKFKVPDLERLAPHLRLRINTEVGPDGVVEFDKTEKIAAKLLKRMKPYLTSAGQ